MEPAARYVLGRVAAAGRAHMKRVHLHEQGRNSLPDTMNGKKKEIYMEVFQFSKTLIPSCKLTDRHSHHLAMIHTIPN